MIFYLDRFTYETVHEVCHEGERYSKRDTKCRGRDVAIKVTPLFISLLGTILNNAISRN